MLDGVPQLPEHYVEPNGLDALAAQVATGNLTAVSGLQGEGGTGKSVLAAAVAHRTGTANVPPYLTDKNVVGALPLKTPAGMPVLGSYRRAGLFSAASCRSAISWLSPAGPEP